MASSSIHSTTTARPLQVTSDLMKEILVQYEVDPSFESVLNSFGEAPNVAESGAANICRSELRDHTTSKRGEDKRVC